MFERKPLRADVGAEILGRIIDGRLPSGIRINETHLSQELGISRTPLREAMLCLATEGVLAADMGRGFQVPALTAAELGDLLGVLAVLLPVAVREETADGQDLRAQVELGNLLGRARLQAGEAGPLCEHLYALLLNLARQSGNQVLRETCRSSLRKLLRYLFQGHDRGWRPEQLLDGLEAGLESLQRGERQAAAESLGHCLRELATELAPLVPVAVRGEG